MQNIRDLKEIIQVSDMFPLIDSISMRRLSGTKITSRKAVLPSMTYSLSDFDRIQFMRMSSELFPFASRAEYGYNLSFAAEALKVEHPSGNRA
jgi:hypothetical protein